MKENLPPPLPQDEPPPIMGTWQRMYALVIVLHAFIIYLFYLFTHAYS